MNRFVTSTNPMRGDDASIETATEAATPNRRILLIDDSPSIHDDFRKVLAEAVPRDTLDHHEAELFGIVAPPKLQFQLDSAYGGQDGLRLVEAALGDGEPYALAFVDMRMPPGWDGIETVERLWQADPDLQVVICTAFADHPWDEVLARLDVQDRLLILKKPFDLIEVSQLATTLTAKWALARQSAVRTRELVATVLRLRTSESELRYTSQELESFAYSVAHDLRSPLAIIGSFGKLLAEELGDSTGKAAHFLERILANADTSQQLLTGLLGLTDIARSQLHMKNVDISRVARQIVAELQHESPGRQASIHIEDGLQAWGDARLMQCALRNLLGNAWKFTSRLDMTEIVVGAFRQTSLQDTFFVRDNGCGFEMEHAEKLFQNFHRLHDAAEYPGTGVGLATVSRVLVRHRGHVWADSTPGRGSTFYFSLPRGPLAAEGAQARQAAEER